TSSPCSCSQRTDSLPTRPEEPVTTATDMAASAGPLLLREERAQRRLLGADPGEEVGGDRAGPAPRRPAEGGGGAPVVAHVPGDADRARRGLAARCGVVAGQLAAERRPLAERGRPGRSPADVEDLAAVGVDRRHLALDQVEEVLGVEQVADL